MPYPQNLYISLSQHIGKPSIPIVAVGDVVKRGQKIAGDSSVVSASVFSPVSGKVTAIEKRPTILGKAEHIVIENDNLYTEEFLPPLQEHTAENIVNRILEAGIIGMGGAGFPTQVKLRPQEKIDTFILNAIECEPYITCDYRAMLEYTKEVVLGSILLATAVKADRVVIAIESNKPQAAKLITEYVTDNALDVDVVLCKTKYPQGAEKQLVYAVTKRKIPLGKLPSSVGCAVNNAHTALAAYRAVYEGIPCFERLMTVSGLCAKNPCNMWVANGTTYADVISHVGITEDVKVAKMISGGPMMGFAFLDENISTTKTSGCLLLLSEKEAFVTEPQPCINCGRCAKACPMKLMPMYIDRYALSKEYDLANKYGAMNCIECGCCSFVCPAKRTLVQSIKIAKNKIRSVGVTK